MWAELQEVATELATSDDRCFVLTGAGGAFCSGADLWEADAPRVHQLAAMRRVNRVIQALHDPHQPTLASVPGAAAGVGVAVALGCAPGVAPPDARFSLFFSQPAPA